MPLPVVVGGIVKAVPAIYSFIEGVFKDSPEEIANRFELGWRDQARSIFNNPSHELYGLSQDSEGHTYDAIRKHIENWDDALNKTGRANLPYHVGDATRKGEIYDYRNNRYVDRKKYEKEMVAKRNLELQDEFFAENPQNLESVNNESVSEKKETDEKKDNTVFYVVLGFVLIVAAVSFFYFKKK